MAKITKTPTGRPNIGYKGKYLELKSKYEKLLEHKVGIVAEAPIELQTPAEAPAEAPIDTSNKSNGEEPAPKEVAEENLIDTPEKVSKELELEEAELEIEKPKANPNDFDFRCGDCKELFMKDGNEFEGGIKCPDCGKVYPNG